jgi:hypothetical protein
MVTSASAKLGTLFVFALVGCNSILGIDEHPLASGGAAGGAGRPAVLGPPGCFEGTPSTDNDFFNRCTTSSYLEFDNCERLGLCAGEVPPLADPVTTTPDTPTSGAASPPSLGCYDAAERKRLIFMQGSTNFTSFIQAMAPLVWNNRYVIVWQPTSSCLGAGAGGYDVRAGKNLMRNPTSDTQAYASFYDASGVGTPCLLGNSPNAPDANSEITDIGQSDVFADDCPLPSGQSDWIPGTPDYADVGHYLGPIQAMVFVTPPASTQRVISAEAARMAFGMGGGGANPWTDPDRLFRRSASTGTNNILSRAIDVPNDKWWGIDTTSAPGMLTAILTTSSTDSEKTLGTLSIDFADRARESLHILSFQAQGQLAGFLPDSDANSRDKQNVRDGHYSPWGPIHLYTKLSSGQTSAQAAAFIVPFTVPNQALVDATIAGGAVPVCAMHVARDQEMGPIRAFEPSFSCDCYFAAQVSGSNRCQTCAGAADCPTSLPACNLGFCERD